jgi:hypothetical protein
VTSLEHLLAGQANVADGAGKNLSVGDIFWAVPFSPSPPHLRRVVFLGELVITAD